MLGLYQRVYWMIMTHFESVLAPMVVYYASPIWRGRIGGPQID